MQIEIICTGDEILSGKIINSNFSYMSRKLEEVGLSVVWGTTVELVTGAPAEQPQKYHSLWPHLKIATTKIIYLT